MQETFSMTSIVYFDLDYTDLLCEMSQKYEGLILNETRMGNAVGHKFIKKNRYTKRSPCCAISYLEM